ncbi:putative S-adenosyl-L-methionine-dependent RNA methyltransferase RSM22, mitochondrial [Pseudozyma hubeiensis]|nr:putative S-adenosyl-L-methionine-dependent RNA methyltransferase RSM22, mitochondrial [Pseudozyma hubeiensis]
MKAVLHPRGSLRSQAAYLRHVSSSAATGSSRAAALAKAAEASATASERLAAGGPPMIGPSFTSRQDANKLDPYRLHSDHDQASAQLNLSSSQARRSRAARFGTSRHATYAPASLSSASTIPDELEEDDLALSYASPTGTSTSSIYLPEYVAWAISQLIAAANDPKLLRADHLKLAHLTDPQEHMAEAAHIPPKRSSLLHLATVSPHRYAAILAVLSEVRQRLSTRAVMEGGSEELEEALPRWLPDTVLDFDCAAGEGLWAAAHVFREDDSEQHSATSVQQYHGFDRRPNLLKSGKKVAQSSASNVSPAEPAKSAREVKLKDEGEEIVVDGVTYYEQEEHQEEVDPDLEQQQDEPELEYFSGPKPAMSSVTKKFQSVPLARDLASVSSSRSLALSAFALSLMTNDTNRFEAVQAMWDSGAEVIVIIDSATPRGFASVASARAQLLQLGQKTDGSHVVAPCSHDKPCPLLHPFSISSAVASAVGARSDTGNPAKSSDVCGFTARYHTPTFLRRTKHSDRGEENVGYSYVVVRRGTRPSLVSEAKRRLGVDRGAKEEQVRDVVEELTVEAAKTRTGILDLLRTAKKANTERKTLEEIGAIPAIGGDEGATAGDADTAPVGEGEMSDEQAMDELLKLLPDAVKAEFAASSSDTDSPALTAEQLDSIMASVRSTASTSATSDDYAEPSTTTDASTITLPAPTSSSELAMRLESYTWPRLIRSPLKKGGHVTLDACCSSGNIERFTISKASGKQAYQDARKAKWGDLFPHPSRSRSVVKVLNPLTAAEMQSEEGEELGLEQLTLRAPSKLNRGKGPVVIGSSDEDDDEILRELFDHPSSSSSSPPINHPSASYTLISPNLITPTKKQLKKQSINYSSKWNSTPTTTSSKLSNTKTNLNTRQTIPQPPIEHSFTSSLSPSDRWGEQKVKERRSSRKKSRGDWNQELFGR